MIAIPAYVQTLLSLLRGAGYAAYPVGGCVRDSLMGREPADWDLCTAARPEQTEAALAGYRFIETGLRHGTVTVLAEGRPVEITTFRADGTYRDNRRPESVSFISSLEEDLARRDFTVNAMALGADGEVIDPWGGRADLAAGVIRCVGEPARRFGEDALRILRALRFASALDFALEPATARSAVEDRALLDAVARERVFAELRGILAGPGVSRVLLDYAPVIFQIIPELAPLAGFDQKSPYHIHDVWTHTALAVGAVAPDPMLRLTMLLHDAAKPDTFSVDGAGVGHFYGHGEAGAEKADAVLRRLRCPNADRERIGLLIKEHAIQPPQTERAARRLLARVGRERATDLAHCWRADCADRSADVRARDLAVIETAERALAAALAGPAPCFSVRELAVDGRDVMALGVPEGPGVGRVLDALFAAVADGMPNERDALLARAGQLVQKGLQ